MRNEQAAEILQNIFQRAVDSARPGPVIPPALPEKPKGRCVVIGAGKASAAMAAAVDAAWPDVDVSGVVVTRYGHAEVRFKMPTSVHWWVMIPTC